MTYDNCSTPSCGAESSASYNPYNRGLVYGVGVNDFPGRIFVDGKVIKSYEIWRAMLGRCYCKTIQVKHPTYKDCTVSDEWHYFANFEKWFSANYIEGSQLDKDLLFPGNKVYSADTCIFVSRAVNLLLTNRANARGVLPLGVCKHGERFRAQLSVYSYRILLGVFATALLAHQAWQKAKADHIEAFLVTDKRIRKALDLRVAQLRDDLLHNRITEKL